MPSVYTQEQVDTKLGKIELDISELRRLVAFLMVKPDKKTKERTKKAALLNGYQQHQLQFENGVQRKRSGIGPSPHEMGHEPQDEPKEDVEKEETEGTCDQGEGEGGAWGTRSSEK